MNLSELTDGLSQRVLVLSTDPNPAEVLQLGQDVYRRILAVQQDILSNEQTIEEQEADILVLIAADSKLSNDLKRKAAKQALCAEDEVLMEAKYNKLQAERKLAALEFTASQYRVLTKLFNTQQ